MKVVQRPWCKGVHASDGLKSKVKGVNPKSTRSVVVGEYSRILSKG